MIAKLDRLARNVHFISGLMESKVDFVAVDNPYADRLHIHILAAVAEHEREMTSLRTKAALQQAKRELAEKGQRVSLRGRVYTRLGNPPATTPAARPQSYLHSNHRPTLSRSCASSAARAAPIARSPII